MKQRIIIQLFGLGFFLGLLVLTGSTAQPVQAESTYQDTACDELLMRILDRAGWGGINQPHGGCEYLGVSSNFYITASLSIDQNDGSPFVVSSCSDETVPPCTETTLHGYPAVTAISSGAGSVGWTMPRGETEYRFYIFVGEGYDAMTFAEEILSAAEFELPSSDQFFPEPGEPPAGPVQSNSDCAGVTPEKLRAGGVAVLQCRLHCDPTIMSDDELWVCINQYSGQPGDSGDDLQDPFVPNPGDQPDGDTPIFPGDEIESDQPPTLGPLATTPLVPLAGALIGTLLGWLVSVATTSGNVLKALAAPPLSHAQTPSVRPMNNMNEQGLYWSERPWDEAGPGYVSKDEYEQTKDMLERGYKWTNSGWQAPEEIQQSEQWQQNDRAATSREDARLRAQIEQDRLNAARPQPVVSEQIEPPVQENQEESPFVFEPGVEGAFSGDQGSSKMTPAVGANIGLYKNQWYNAKDVAGDLKLGGMDIGNYKADLQMGKVQAGAGVSYDAEGNAYSAGASLSASTYQLTGESVLGNKYLGATADAQIDGPKLEAVAGYKDGSIGASIGGSLVSTEVGVGMNVANFNVGVRGGLSFGLELGLTVGKETELKLGPFKLALSLGAAKTGL